MIEKKEILREVIVDSWCQLNNNMETDVTNEEMDELLGYILSDPRITDILGEGDKWVSIETPPENDRVVYVYSYGEVRTGWYEEDSKSWYSEFTPEYLGESVGVREVVVDNWMHITEPQPPSEADERSELPPTDKEV